MPASVETKIREALVYRLGQITVANGYVNDIGDVFDEFPENPGGISNFPAVAVLSGRDSRSDFDNEMLYLTAMTTLVVFVDPSGDIVEDTETIKQDIQRMLGLHPDLPGSGSAPTCQLAVYASSEPFGRVLDVPGTAGLRGTKIMVEVRSQQELANPTAS